ncbi:MAG: SpoIIE family protein phosphatase [Planctomycetes bacterium]|nr:SpoIIE family protein phosphatase [Planctomycetota bacterium]
MYDSALVKAFHSPLFKGVDVYQLEQLVTLCEVKSLISGQSLLEPGQENHTLYIHISGSLKIYLEQDCQHSFAVMPGECIGEMSIIDGKAVSAYVLAASDCEVLAIPELVFWRNFACIPEVIKNLLMMLTERMRRRSQALKEAHRTKDEFEQISKEMRAAGHLQKSMLPRKRPYFDNPQLDVHAIITPAKHVGGDFFDTLDLPNDQVMLVVGDVAGKGMPAALYMMRAITTLRSLVEAEHPCEKLMEDMNEQLCLYNEGNTFVTICITILCKKTGKITIYNGGHNPAIIRRTGGKTEVITEAKGLLLGAFGGYKYKPWHGKLSAQDSLFLYTDGITEAENPKREFFTMERFIDEIKALPDEANLKPCLNHLYHEVNLYADNADQSDDMTLLGLRYLGSETDKDSN